MVQDLDSNAVRQSDIQFTLFSPHGLVTHVFGIDLVCLVGSYVKVESMFYISCRPLAEVYTILFLMAHRDQCLATRLQGPSCLLRIYELM